MEKHTATHNVVNHHIFTELIPKLKEKNLSSESAKPHSGPREIPYVRLRGTKCTMSLRENADLLPVSAMLSTVQLQLSPFSPGGITLLSGLVPNCNLQCINH